jgi:ADP-dependent NAD(P)H-hydrate dehydratase
VTPHGVMNIAPPVELRMLPVRDPAGHKGTFGTVAIVGGERNAQRIMIGAPALAARAALRAGAGLARLVCPDGVVLHAVSMCPSATGVPLPVNAAGEVIAHEAAEVIDGVLAECSCVAIGPGLGQSAGARALTLRILQQSRVPVVVDADAINVLASVPELSRDLRAACVLTPHPGEFRTLAGALNITQDPTHHETRGPAAEALAQRLGCIVVLKGRHSVVTNGHDTWVCDRGHPCLATGGTGDVLTGLLGGLLAIQHENNQRGAAHTEDSAIDLRALARARLGSLAHLVPGAPQAKGAKLSMMDAVRIGVHAHACAGELWALQMKAHAGLLAEELADLLPSVLAQYQADFTPTA